MTTPATPRPWTVVGRILGDVTLFGPNHYNVRGDDPADPEAGPNVTTSGQQALADAEFIVYAVNHIEAAEADRDEALRLLDELVTATQEANIGQTHEAWVRADEALIAGSRFLAQHPAAGGE